jgi:hypothetical protein
MLTFALLVNLPLLLTPLLILVGRKLSMRSIMLSSQNNTWHLVQSTRGQNIINGTIDRYKACLVAKGFKQ